MRHYFNIKQYIYAFQIDVMLLDKVLHLEEEIQVILPDNLLASCVFIDKSVFCFYWSKEFLRLRSRL